MKFSGRSRELGAIRSALDARESSLIEVLGPPGVGKTALVSRATRGFFTLRHRTVPLPDPLQRRAFLRTLRHGLPGAGAPWDPGEGEPSWRELLSYLTGGLPEGARPSVLVIDDAHRLAESRARFEAPLAEAMGSFDGLHVVLTAPTAVVDENGPLASRPSLRIRLGPLPFRSALPFLPGSSARERLLAYGALGGMPATLRHVDQGDGVPANLRRILFDPGAPLEDAGIVLLERFVQTPSRYAGILRALAGGEGDWGMIHAGLPDLGASGQVAPYLRRLEELGLVEVRRSLDARPTTRSRRYRILDPLLAFWFRHRLGRTEEDDGERVPSRDAIRAMLESQAASVFPSVCRQFMDSDAMEHLGHNARECGSLWGPDVDIDVAGILTSGAAFYGHATWEGSGAAAGLKRLDTQLRNTRYGFGREARLRLIFTGDVVPTALERQVARRYDAEVFGPDDLAGSP